MRDPEIESVCLSQKGEPGSGSILVLSRSLYQDCVFESWVGVFEKSGQILHLFDCDNLFAKEAERVNIQTKLELLHTAINGEGAWILGFSCFCERDRLSGNFFNHSFGLLTNI